MRAVIYDKFKKKVELSEVSLSNTKNSEDVFFYPAYVAICGSDLHMYMGSDIYGWVKEFLILGHEIAGYVENESDLYIVNPYIPCNQCSACKNGEPNYCIGPDGKIGKDQPPYSLQYGFRRDGGMVEKMIVRRENLIKVPPGLSPDISAPAEAIAVGYRAVKQGLGLVNYSSNSVAVVIGPGPIGLGVCFVLSSKKINTYLLGLPEDKQRLSRAVDMGIIYATDNIDEIKKEVSKASNNEGATIVFETSGSEAGWQIALSLVKRRGVIVGVGIPSKPCNIDLKQVVRGGVVISGSYGVTKEDLLDALLLIKNNEEKAKMFIDKKFRLNEAIEAFEYAKKSSGKVLISIGGD